MYTRANKLSQHSESLFGDTGVLTLQLQCNGMRFYIKGTS